MKVILLQQVKDLGEPGDVVEVAAGYGRNFLIPRGLAVEATKANLKKLQEQQAARQRQEERELEAARQIAGELNQATITIQAKAGESGRLFGSVTTADIAKAIAAQKGHKIDRRKILLDEPLRELGSTVVEIRLHPQVTTSVTVEVVPQS